MSDANLVPSAVVGVEKSEDERQKEKELRKAAVKRKIKAVAKMSLVFKVLREEKETVNELKKQLGTDVLPPGTLTDGALGLQKAIQGFQDAKLADIQNERMPPRKASMDVGTDLGKLKVAE